MTKEKRFRLIEIVLYSGETISDVLIETRAPRIPGFVALRGQLYKDTTRYVSLSDISSMTIANPEFEKLDIDYYLSPEPTVRVEVTK